MNWIPALGTASLGIAGLLMSLAIARPRVCIHVADFFKPLCLGAAFGSACALLGLVTARAIVLGAVNENRDSLTAGGPKAVQAVSTSLDSGIAIWLGYAIAPMVIFGILLAAVRLSELVLRDASKGDATKERGHGKE
ncbi:hypothetical protein [Xanthomonas campestris]|uniref:hypothetical protein n=1 Tax=Xanthomonas campestris TaxID=339 RepID=UPI000E32C75C|nr:hypothetical protein [Xanthomonas campestris]RFF46206.1 hypothetical protein D0A35_18900 [Xanthomonas campestris]